MNTHIDVRDGLTKREYFAAMALQGMLANLAAIRKEGFRDCEIEEFAVMRVAPMLLTALESVDLSCCNDVLNPCWDDRPTDVPGKHWGVGNACPTCTVRAAIAKATQS